MKCSSSLIFAVVGLLVEILYVTKGVLLIARYSYPPKLCLNSSALVEGDDSIQIAQENDRAYYFTVAVYAFCSVLRCIEYIPLVIGLDRFWKDKEKDEFSLPKLQYRELFIWSLLAVVLLLGLSLPAVGIAVELELKHNCGDSKAAIFLVYCFFNFIRYTWAFSVRAGMVFVTFIVREIWKNDAISEISSDMLTANYINKGKRAQKVARIFQKWFLFPWIVFFLASSLEAKNVLRVWNGDRVGILPLPLAYYLLYNINQILLLLIPYLCGLKMDYYHHKFYNNMKLKVGYQTAKLIPEVDNYNFVPRVWGLDIKVQMDSPIYILFLILSLLFTICGTLF